MSRGAQILLAGSDVAGILLKDIIIHMILSAYFDLFLDTPQVGRSKGRACAEDHIWGFVGLNNSVHHEKGFYLSKLIARERNPFKGSRHKSRSGNVASSAG